MTDSNIMPTALFYNFSDESYTGMWGGQTKTFPAGSKTFMPAYLAQHFAKHLTNRELQKLGKDTATSPKAPEDVPDFFEMFKKAYVRDRDMEKKQTSLDAEIDSVNLNREQSEPSMNLPRTSKAVTVESKPAPAELDLNATVPAPHEVGPGSQPQMIAGPDNDEDDDDENAAFESKPVPPTTSDAKVAPVVGL